MSRRTNRQPDDSRRDCKAGYVFTFLPSPLRPGLAFHILDGDRFVADLTWDNRPIPRSPEGHPFGWVLRWRGEDDNAITESSDYAPECQGILVNEGGQNRLDREPHEVLWPALENALALAKERFEAHM